MFSVIIGNSMYFPHGRESTDNQLCIKRKGIFFLVVADFFVTDLLCQETTFEQLARSYAQCNSSQGILDFAGTSKLIIPSHGLFSHACDS